MEHCRWIVRGVAIVALSFAMMAAAGCAVWAYVTHTMPSGEQFHWSDLHDCMSRGDEMHACAIVAAERMFEDVAHNTWVLTDWFQANTDWLLRVVMLALSFEMVAMGGVVVGAAVVTYGVLCMFFKVADDVFRLLFPHTYRYGLSQDLF